MNEDRQQIVTSKYIMRKSNKLVVASLYCLVFLLTRVSLAQYQGDGGMPYFPLAQQDIPQVSLAKPDIKQLRKEDKFNDENGIGPWRFGWNHTTDINLQHDGIWIDLSDGAKIWLIKLYCPQAQTINLTFKDAQIPQGNHLFVYDNQFSSLLGKFTQKHIYQGWLGTELIGGEYAVVEYYVAPENMDNIGSLTIHTVTHGYRLWEEMQEKAFGSAAPCNKNVNCPEAADYATVKRSVVALISGGNGICSGTLINNTSYDGTPYVLTANHCYNSAIPSWVFRFNWEAPGCDNPSSSPAFSSLSGAQLRARRQKSDFMLLEIMGGLQAGTVPSSFNPYFAGWDRSGDTPDYTACIHHPKGDIKKISFDDSPPIARASTIGSVTSDPLGSWKVAWDRGTTTQEASSGSPLFDHNKRIIGQLWGGSATCGNSGTNAGVDFYGRFSVSWNPPESTPANQLKEWLDPNNTNALFIDGYEPGNIPSKKLVFIAVNEPPKITCNNQVSLKLSFMNLGTTTLTDIALVYGWDGNMNLTYTGQDNVTSFQASTISFPAQTFTTGQHVFWATITHMNGQVYANTDTLKYSFFVMENPKDVNLSLTLDLYPEETSWILRHSSGVELYQSPSYSDTDDTDSTYQYTFCLSPGCYTFTIYDSYGDGMTMGSGSGQFSIKMVANDSLLAQMTPAQADFGDSLVRSFCIDGIISPPPPPPIPPDPPTNPVAISDLEQATISLFPNPSTGIIYWPTDQQVTELRLYDIQGKELTRQLITDKQHSFSLAPFSNGIYWVELEHRGGHKTCNRVVLLAN